MTSEEQIALANEFREKLLKVPQEERNTIIWMLDFCRDCGSDTRGPSGLVYDTRSCTCMRDE